MAKKTDEETTEKKILSDDALDKLMNGKEFSYNVTQDPNYVRLRDEYEKEGRQAMRDTIGKASAMTGGYGNSYAQTVGQQVYNDHLGELNKMIPELEDRAYAKYRDQIGDQKDIYSILYGRERDAESDRRYNQEWEHNLEREGIEDKRYDDEIEHRNAREAIEDARYEEQKAAAAAAAETEYNKWLAEFNLKADAQSFSQWLEEAKLDNETAKLAADIAYQNGTLSTNQYRAITDRLQVGVNQQNADTAAYNADTSRINAITNATKAGTKSGLTSLKTAEEVSDAIEAAIAFVMSPNHGSGDIDAWFDAQFGDQADNMYTVVMQTINDNHNNRRSGSKFYVNSEIS